MNLRNKTEKKRRFVWGKSMLYQYGYGDKPLDGYTIKRGLGIGGFGEVYFAESDSGKEVALKHIQKSLDVEIRGVRQCLNLRHPNLVGIYDIRYDQAGRGWIIMEFIHGQTLREVLDHADEGMPIHHAISLFVQILAGCIHLHDAGIVHRDLKPANIFIENGMAKIGDYGLAKFISTSRRGGQTEAIGTLHYMAPEIAKGEYGKEIDFYSLGIILFEMFTGKVPFEGQSAGEVLIKHLTADPDLSRIPKAFSPIVLKALTKDPTNRYRDGRRMLADLGYCLDSGGYAIVSSVPKHSSSARIDPSSTAIVSRIGRLFNQSRERLARELKLKPLPQFEMLPGRQQALQLRDLQRQQLRQRSTLSKIHTATRATMFTGFICMLGTLLGGHLMLSNTEFSNKDWLGAIAWLGVMTALTSATVIFLTRRWETRTEFSIIFRFVLMSTGILLGLASFQLSEYLLIPWEKISGEIIPLVSYSNMTIDPATNELKTEIIEYRFNSSWKGFYRANGSPLLKAHMAYFAVLMWSIRWWKLSDALRKNYFGFMSIVWVFLIAHLIYCVFYFPMPWAILLACAVSVVVQLSSPWVEPMKTLTSISGK
jgi:serine/threonine protein kinase